MAYDAELTLLHSMAFFSGTQEEFSTVFEKAPARAGDKRSKDRNDDPADIDG